MAALYIASMGESAGKSTLCAGLGKRRQAEGKRVGFLKPLSIAAGVADGDAEFMKQLLNLEEPVELLCPVILSAGDLAASLGEENPPWLNDVEKAFGKISQGKDIVLLEGVGGFESGSDMAKVAGKIVERLKVRAILLVRYGAGMETDKIVAAAKMFAGNLLGVVINAVPERRMETVKQQIVPSLEQSGVKVLGVLPEKRELYAVTVGELVEHIGGNILNSRERSNELVESVMVGAMSVDSALSYLQLKPNKAVITRGDRPDIQLAALETSTKCIVLTNNVAPAPGILSRAQELNVPIVSVERDTPGTMEIIESVFDNPRIYSEGKVEKIGQILEQNLDLEAVYNAA